MCLQKRDKNVKDLAFHSLRSVFNFQTGRPRTSHLSYRCLPFTWTNRSVHSVDKWYAKFRTDKFCPGIALTICTKKFNFPKNDLKGLKMVSKMALKKWDTKFPFGIFLSGITGPPFQMFVAPKLFPMERPKKWCSIYFATGFSENIL